MAVEVLRRWLGASRSLIGAQRWSDAELGQLRLEGQHAIFTPPSIMALLRYVQPPADRTELLALREPNIDLPQHPHDESGNQHIGNPQSCVTLHARWYYNAAVFGMLSERTKSCRRNVAGLPLHINMVRTAGLEPAHPMGEGF